MAGNEVDYSAFGTFVSATQEDAGEDGTASSGPLQSISSAGGITGSMGTDSAMFFGAMNRQAIRSIGAFMSDQMVGRLALASAAANVAIAYHDGDLGQKGQVSDVMDGILSPNGKNGTVRGDMDAAAAEEGDSGGNSSAASNVPPTTTDADGNIVDSQGRILFYANGTPGNSEALDDAGVQEGNESTFFNYITTVRGAQSQYVADWTDSDPEDITPENAQQMIEDNEGNDASPEQEALGDARNDLVKPTSEEDYNGEGYGDPNGVDDPPEEPEPEDQPDISVYQEPTPG